MKVANIVSLSLSTYQRYDQSVCSLGYYIMHSHAASNSHGLVSCEKVMYVYWRLATPPTTATKQLPSCCYVAEFRGSISLYNSLDIRDTLLNMHFVCSSEWVEMIYMFESGGPCLKVKKIMYERFKLLGKYCWSV